MDMKASIEATKKGFEKRGTAIYRGSYTER